MGNIETWYLSLYPITSIQLSSKKKKTPHSFSEMAPSLRGKALVSSPISIEFNSPTLRRIFTTAGQSTFEITASKFCTDCYSGYNDAMSQTEYCSSSKDEKLSFISAAPLWELDWTVDLPALSIVHIITSPLLHNKEKHIIFKEGIYDIVSKSFWMAKFKELSCGPSLSSPTSFRSAFTNLVFSRCNGTTTPKVPRKQPCWMEILGTQHIWKTPIGTVGLLAQQCILFFTHTVKNYYNTKKLDV